jgi:hypothetical protein
MTAKKRKPQNVKGKRKSWLLFSLSGALLEDSLLVAVFRFFFFTFAGAKDENNCREICRSQKEVRSDANE